MAAETAALVGIASSTITFFDFSIRLYQVAREIRKACGELPPEIESCHRSIVSFARMLERLQRISQLNQGCYGPQTELDSNLHDLVDDCRKNGEELLALLEKMKPKIRSQRGSKAWRRDMQTALRVARKEGKLRRLEQGFRALKDDMCLLLNERILVTADATLQALERHQERYLQALSKSSENERQVIARLTRYDDMLNALRHEMMASGDTSDRIVGLLEAALEKGGKRELDPRFIYIALPSVSLNPLPCWNQFTQKAARALGLRDTGYPWGEIYKILQPTPSQIRWRLLESSDQIGKTNLQLTGTKPPRAILFSTPGSNYIGVIEASTHPFCYDAPEMWKAAYRQDVGWKYWVLWQTVQRVRPVLYRKSLSSGYERDEQPSLEWTSTEGKREFTWGVEIIGGFDWKSVCLFIVSLFTALTLALQWCAMDTKPFLGREIGPFIRSTGIDSRIRHHCNDDNLAALLFFVVTLSGLWSIYTQKRTCRFRPISSILGLLLGPLFPVISTYLPFGFYTLNFSFSIFFFLHCNAVFASFGIVTGMFHEVWTRANWAARRRVLFAICLYIEAPWATIAYLVSIHHMNKNGVGVRSSLEGKYSVVGLCEVLGGFFTAGLLLEILCFDSTCIEWRI